MMGRDGKDALKLHALLSIIVTGKGDAQYVPALALCWKVFLTCVPSAWHVLCTIAATSASRFLLPFFGPHP